MLPVTRTTLAGALVAVSLAAAPAAHGQSAAPGTAETAMCLAGSVVQALGGRPSNLAVFSLLDCRSPDLAYLRAARRPGRDRGSAFLCRLR